MPFFQRPQVVDWCLAVFCFLAGIGTFASIWNGELFWSGSPNYTNPFARYDSNPGIRLIDTSALVVDVGVVVLIVAWRFRQLPPQIAQLFLMGLCLVGAALTWTELWHGSTFCYGELRDKQGLPFGVNNGGVIGSYLFLGYVAWRASSLVLPRPAAFVAGATLLIALWFGHRTLLSLVEKPWNLWQS